MTRTPGPAFPLRLLTIGGLLAVLLLGGWWVWQKTANALTNKPLAVRVGLPTQISAGAFYVGVDQKLFASQGVDLTTQTFLLGKDALQTVLDGKADLAVLADTPFMFSVMSGEKIAAVSVIFGSRKTMSVIARSDRNIKTAKDLQGKTIGTLFGTNTQYFLDALLLANGVPANLVNVVDIKPDEMMTALRSGRLDAATGWRPEQRDRVLDDATVIFGEDEFVFRFLLAGKKDYIDSHPEEVRRVLAALDASIRFIQQQPDKSKTIIAQALGMNEADMTRFHDPRDFYLTLNQTLLLSLSDQTRWAMKKGLVPIGEIPDYRDYLRHAPLEAVLPNAVKFIR